MMATYNRSQAMAGAPVLSERDRKIVASVGELRLLQAGQVERLHFPLEHYASELSARRMTRRTLERLTRQRCLVRLERRIGGVTAGSAGYVYALGPGGVRLLGDRARRHYREPSAAFVEHTLAVAEVAVDLTVTARGSTCELLEVAGEPRCWRVLPGFGGRQLLRPDLFVSLGHGEWEERWFIEMDLGTEHLPTLVKKCQAYLAYYRSGREQARFGIFPKVAWVVQTQRRAGELGRAIAGLRGGVDGLFSVCLAPVAVEHIVRGSR